MLIAGPANVNEPWMHLHAQWSSTYGLVVESVKVSVLAY
jgi:hypothetical protein